MSGTVSGLVDRGWVSKEPDPADARATLVTLTPDGIAVLGEARRSNGSLVAERLRLTDLTPTDVADAVAVLRSLLDPPKGSS
jgi:DNA-binding MarR family transcriptional regulator